MNSLEPELYLHEACEHKDHISNTSIYVYMYMYITVIYRYMYVYGIYDRVIHVCPASRETA